MIDRNGTYVIRGCLRGADSSDDYENRCVRRLDNQAEQALRKASEKVGNELAKEWNAKRIGACSCKTVTRPPMGTSFGAAGQWSTS